MNDRVNTKEPVRLSDLTREQFEALGAAKFGDVWKTPAADFLGVNRRTLSRWIGKGEFPDWAVKRLRDESGRTLIAAVLRFADQFEALGRVATQDEILNLVAAVQTYRGEIGT